MWSSTHLANLVTPAPAPGTVSFVVRCDDPAPASSTVLSVALLAAEHPEWDAQLVLLTHDERLVHPLVELVGGDVVVARSPVDAGWDAGTALASSSRVALLDGGQEVDAASVERLLAGPERCGPGAAGGGLALPPSSPGAPSPVTGPSRLPLPRPSRDEPGTAVDDLAREVGAVRDSVSAVEQRLRAVEGAVGQLDHVLRQVVASVQQHALEIERTTAQLAVLEQRTDQHLTGARAGVLASLTAAGGADAALTELASLARGLEEEYRRMRARTAFVSSFEARLHAVEQR